MRDTIEYFAITISGLVACYFLDMKPDTLFISICLMYIIEIKNQTK